MVINEFLTALLAILGSPQSLMLVLMAVALGVILGAVPGISTTMAIAVLLPITFGMEMEMAILFLLGVFISSVYGGSVSAILINIPGTPAAMVTQLDGYPMAQRGQGGQALKWALYASTVGGLFGIVLLIGVSPLMAAAASLMRSAEFAAIAILGLVMLAFASGGSPIRGILVGLIGLLCGMVGFDTMTDIPRFDYGVPALQGGVDIVAMMLGIFGLAEVLKNLAGASNPHFRPPAIGNAALKLSAVFSRWASMVRGSITGAIIGCVPAVGSAIAVSVAYAQEVRLAKDPSAFGQGDPRGITAPEAANSSSVGGSLVPMMTLGIPGDTVTAVLMGALLMHGLRPGPLLYVDNPGFFASVYASLFVGVIATLIIGLLLARVVVRLMGIPPRILLIAIAVLCVVGAFAIRNNVSDIYVMIFFGCVGYVLHLLRLPAAPLAFGLILGPILEENLGRALLLSRGSWSIFVERPLSLSILLITALVLLLPLLTKLARRLRQPRLAGAVE
ncbi:C4-dicarboxylate ABC transporter permease [Pseudomonas sp. G11-1]|nr:C4-dicarboxylate ABC transporter permease [Pseudomonas sp. G11-1]MCO5788194.1 C4-dicarboxylate ABC transporter permease [Pseudomonas sp. G11-2]